MVPRKGHDLSSGIQTLEYVIRGIYIVLGLTLVSSLVCSVIGVVKVLDRWDICGRTKCKYAYYAQLLTTPMFFGLICVVVVVVCFRFLLLFFSSYKKRTGKRVL